MFVDYDYSGAAADETWLYAKIWICDVTVDYDPERFAVSVKTHQKNLQQNNSSNWLQLPPPSMTLRKEVLCLCRVCGCGGRADGKKLVEP